MIGYWVRDPLQDTTEDPSDYDTNKREHTNITNTADDQLMRFFVTDGATAAGATPTAIWESMNFGDSAGQSQVLAQNVKSLRIRCWSTYDGTDFTEEWEDETANPSSESKVNWDTVIGGSGLFPNQPYDDGVLPRAVKITVVVQDQNNVAKEREFSTIVYLDNAMR